eukprot:5208291-Alexandrium_andersonii.AAC.1
MLVCTVDSTIASAIVSMIDNSCRRAVSGSTIASFLSDACRECALGRDRARLLAPPGDGHG